MKVKIIDGPNINLLGIREPHVYGTRTYSELCEVLAAASGEFGVNLIHLQSNHEGIIIDEIQKDDYDCLIINPGGLTHTSVSVADAIRAAGKRTVEVHLTNIFARPGRNESVTGAACEAVIAGFGIDSYVAALGLLSGGRK